MTPSLIFLPEIQRQFSEDAAAIHAVMARYYQGVEEARVDLLEEVFHSAWLMKDTDTPGAATLNVEGKTAFIERVRGHGPYPGYAAGRRVATVSTAHDRLACVRVDKAESRSSTVFVLFKLGGDWTLIDKVWVNPRSPADAPRPIAPVLQAVSSRLDGYFRALDGEDRVAIEASLHERFEMKCVGSNGFVGRSLEEALQGHLASSSTADSSRLVAIDVFQESMAVIRIDLPADEETRFIFMLRIGGVWQLVLERRSQGHA